MIKLGDRVKDLVTGFEGIVIGRTEWLYGCTTLGVKSSELKDGKPIESLWFDEQSLDALATEPGGPGAAGLRASDRAGK